MAHTLLEQEFTWLYQPQSASRGTVQLIANTSCVSSGRLLTESRIDTQRRRRQLHKCRCANYRVEVQHEFQMIYRNVTHGILETVRLLCMRNTESSAISRMALTAAGMIVRDDRNLIA